MKMKAKVCATAVALLAGTVCFAVQAEARGPVAPVSHPNAWTHHSKLYMSAANVYDAGVRRGSARSSRNAYLRGFHDGTSTAVYTSRQYFVSSAPIYSGVPAYSAAPADGYSSYGNADYGPAIGGYAYDGRTVAVGNGYGNGYGYGYGNGYGYTQYNAGYVPGRLMDVAVTPGMTAQPLEGQNARLSYCAARYQSFDPGSGTFLDNDGYRYYCR